MGKICVYVKDKYEAKLAYLALKLNKKPTTIVREWFEARMDLEESREEVEELSK